MSDPFKPSFRTVPKTGVIYVMSEATQLGFQYGHNDWANLGQGAPECGHLANGPGRVTAIEVNDYFSEYSPVAGMDDLRAAVAELYNRRYRQGMASQYTAANVAISPGGRSGLTRIAASLGNVNLGHFLPDYTAYEELLGIFRNFISIPIILDPEEGFAITPERMRHEIIGKGLSVFLFSNPSNPTGNVIFGDNLAEVCSLAREFHCTMIIDEFYSHYLYGAAAASGLSCSAARYIADVDRDPVVLVDGLTKNWRYPGLRLSWTLAPKPIIERIAAAGSFLDGGASHPVQKMAIPLLTVENADEEARIIQNVFAEKRQTMLDFVKQNDLYLANVPEGGFYIFPSLADAKAPLNDGMEFFKQALQKKVITVPGRFFDVDPGHRRQHIPSRLNSYARLSFGPSEQELSRGLLRLGQLLEP